MLVGDCRAALLFADDGGFLELVGVVGPGSHFTGHLKAQLKTY